MLGAYFLLVFLVCLGVVQLAAAHSGLAGLLIVPSRPWARILGAVLPAGAFLWFTLTGRAKVPGDLAGVEGSEQFLLFFAAAGAAFYICAIIASMTHRSRPMPHHTPDAPHRPEPGMEGLREATLLHLLKLRFRRSGPTSRE